MSARRSKIRVALVLAGTTFAVATCLDPTEIELVVSTNFPCASVRGAAIAIGRPGDDSQSVTATTMSCSDDGGVGTLFVVPSSGAADGVGIRAMLGVSANADQCSAPNFTGCVVARRSLQYTSHHRLVLPINLDEACLDRPCDQNSTCVNGQCVDAGIPDCPSDMCNVADAGTPPPPPPPEDAGTCTSLGPVLVAKVSGFKPQPHLMLTSTGYAVSYETAPMTSTREVYTQTIDPIGNVGMVKKVGTGGPNLATSAVGSDGTHYAYVAMDSATTASAFQTPIMGVMPITTADITATSLSNFGMLWSATTNAYQFIATDTNNVLLGTFTPATAFLGTLIIDSVQSSNLVFSVSNNTYFVASTDPNGSTCRLLTLTSLTPVNSSAQMFTGCSTVRAAVQGSSMLLVTRDTSGSTTATLPQAPSVPPVALGAVDTNSIVALAVGSGFVVVYGANATLRTTSLTTNLDATVPATIATVATSPIVFDAIPAFQTAGYAVAYYDDSASTINFAVRCP